MERGGQNEEVVVVEEEEMTATVVESPSPTDTNNANQPANQLCEP